MKQSHIAMVRSLEHRAIGDDSDSSLADSDVPCAALSQNRMRHLMDAKREERCAFYEIQPQQRYVAIAIGKTVALH